MSSSKQKASMRVRVEWSACRPLTILAATAAIAFSNPIVARAEDNGGFQDLETKYIFGFTIGSSVGDQSDKEFEPDTHADFGKHGGSYGVGQTALEYEYTPTQFMQIELVRPSPITVSTTFLASTTATWGPSTDSKPT
jgi:hypothetical protein